MPSELLLRLVVCFAVLFGLGIALTLPLYKFDLPKFFRSPLFIKILFWVPIFIVFLTALEWPDSFGVAVVAAVIAASFFEALRVAKGYALLYWAVFALAFGHFLLIGAGQANIVPVLITIGFASVLSDASAFFFGNYFGKHKLPASLNNTKSWEGVAGQLVGAFLGVVVIGTFVTSVPTLWLFVPLGIGSALGDLTNSYVKRRAGIKDWSKAIPGHGGFLDRSCSLAGSALLTFYFLKLF
jgi:CDP-diglyceride synthetase